MIITNQEQKGMICGIEGTIRERLHRCGDQEKQQIYKKSLINKLQLIVISLMDYVKLIIRRVKNDGPEIYFIAPGMAKYEEYLKKKLSDGSYLINYHMTKRIKNIDNVKVYNIGILVGVLNRLFNRRRDIVKTVRICDYVYTPIYSKMKGASVFIACFHDFNGYALLFNNKRKTYEITEVQHGSICNYFPYTEPVSFQLADRFIVWNERTAIFLKEHLYRNIDVKIEIMPQAQIIRKSSGDDRWTILYCSSIETKGLHPTFISFLEKQEDRNRLRLVVRLHPRERDKQGVFEEQLTKLGWKAAFDSSKDWLESNPYENTVVVSPWSSTIEEAYDSGIPSVVLDDFGKDRFKNLIDESLCFSSLECCLANLIK